MTAQTFQTILQVAAVLLGFYLAFFKSYFTEKGKNLATIQDISKITKEVESVKNEFVTETERLKTQLNSFAQNFNSIKTLERDALINVNKKYSEWYHTLISFSLVYYSNENYELLNEIALKFSEKQIEFAVAEENLHIYMHDNEVRKPKTQLSILTFEFQVLLLKSISSFITNCKIYNKQKLNVSKELETNLDEEYEKQQDDLVNKSIQQMVDMNGKISPHHIEFIMLANKRIYQLIG